MFYRSLAAHSCVSGLVVHTRRWVYDKITLHSLCYLARATPMMSISGTPEHDDDVKMSVLASQITSLMIVYSTVYSGTNERKLQSSASLAFVRGIHRRPVNSRHKGPVTRKMFPFDDVIMTRVKQLMYILGSLISNDMAQNGNCFSMI